MWAVLTFGLFADGCAGHKTAPLPPPLPRGSVNLDQLVRRHPGWGGVGQYDAALRRLEEASLSLPPAGRPDEKLATLPALPPETAAGPGAAGLSAAGLSAAGVARRLDATQQTLLDGLRARRDMARRDEVEGNRDAWRREARVRFPNPVFTASSGPDLELQLLEADVAALTRTVDNWKPSPPPAPRLNAVKDLLARNQAHLQALLAARESERVGAQVRYADERRLQREARVAYAQAQAQALEGSLQGGDQRLLAAQALRLTAQRAALLAALGRPASLTVPTAGYAGVETLPHGPGVTQAALSAASLAASQARLRAQRARWVKFLYDDTQAAALDVAGQRRCPEQAARPIVVEDEREAVRIALDYLVGPISSKDVRIIRIKDTLSLAEIEVSEAVQRELDGQDGFTFTGQPREMAFDQEGQYLAK